LVIMFTLKKFKQTTIRNMENDQTDVMQKLSLKFKNYT